MSNIIDLMPRLAERKAGQPTQKLPTQEEAAANPQPQPTPPVTTSTIREGVERVSMSVDASDLLWVLTEFTLMAAAVGAPPPSLGIATRLLEEIKALDTDNPIPIPEDDGYMASLALTSLAIKGLKEG